MGSDAAVPKTISYNYRFIFKEGGQKQFAVTLDKESLDLVNKPAEPYPEWTNLTHKQCPNCPLDESQHRHCPLAVQMVELMNFFKDLISCEEVRVVVETETRSYSKELPLQNGVSSLMGIYMVAGGCPVLAKLKPMVRFHLPFANLEETTYRVLSMYLLAQYFLYKKGAVPDWDMKELAGAYGNISKVNIHFCNRLRSMAVEDAGINAVVILDVFASSVKFSLDSDKMSKVENLFSAYFD